MRRSASLALGLIALAAAARPASAQVDFSDELNQLHEAALGLARSSSTVGRPATSRISRNRKSERLIPSIAAFALSDRWMGSGTLRIWIMTGMYKTC